MTLLQGDPDTVRIAERLLELDTPQARAAFVASLDESQAPAVEEALALLERAAAVGEANSAEWRATPATMMHHLTRGRLRLWRYTRLLGEKYREAVTGTSKRQIWSLPARYGKSLLASQWGPAWQLDQRPADKLILVSYGDLLAVENAIGVRDILREHAGTLRVALKRDRQAQNRFLTTEGGGILAAGIMSQITGFGGHGVVFDDPFKDWQEAHSAARRNLVDNQYRAVVTLRLEDEASFVIIVMTRWHGDDLSGRLQDRMQDGSGEAWDVVRLPALAECYDPDSFDPLLRVPDPLGRAPGEPLEPERFSLEAVRARHLSLGSYLTAALEQQRPAPEEGGEIKRAWFHIDDDLPPSFEETITSWDMKLKDKETGDFVAGQTWGRVGGHYWLLAQLRGQWNQATTENAIALAAVREPRVRTHVLENSGNGPEVRDALQAPFHGYEVSDDVAGLLGMTPLEREAVQELRRRGIPNIVLENAKGDKSTRMRAQSGLIEGGTVHLWARLGSLGPYLDEMAAFPNGANDDQVDSTSQALKRLRHSGPMTIHAPQGTLQRPPINTRPMGGMISPPGGFGRRR